MLKKLTSKKSLTILGMNSGTSADGIDLALIQFVPGRKTPKITCIDGKILPYPRKIRRELEKIIGVSDKDFEGAARLDIAYGHYLGRAAKSFLSRKRRGADLIASHGQTVGHYPKKEGILGIRTGATIQLGDGQAIAAETGLPVVSDFRRVDVVLGGEGAPLTPFVNQMLFGDRKKSRIAVNIGGIANYSYHPAGGDFGSVRGGDCGPGNILVDLAGQLLFRRKFDKDGAIARKGKIIGEIIKAIDKANRRRGVSVGREQFDELLLARLVHISRKTKADRYDLMASITATTAKLIHNSIRSYLKDKRLEGVYLSGGGRRNIFLVECLQEHLKPVPVRPIEALGYDGDLLEAVSFAVLGGCFIYGISSTLLHVTGAKAGGVAGKLSLPPG